MLNNMPRETLIFIINKYGSSIIDNPRRFRGLLKDLAPNHQRETNLIILALEQRIICELLQYINQVPLSILIDRLAKRLHDNIGIQKEFATWAVETWSLALNNSKNCTSGKQAISSILDVNLNAEEVDSTEIETTKYINFGKYLVKDGISHDKVTNLEWLRFSYGQDWVNGKIIGEPQKLTWEKALEVPNKFNRIGYAGYKDWRVPTIKELKSLIAKKIGENGNFIDCFVFPGNEEKFWSSSSYFPNNNFSWNVDFFDGSYDWYQNGHTLYIRLVRGHGRNVQ